ncbi:MAG: hypothetical protein GF353_03075, partial [Candidatus Lokiarchaeota archaeon]|nr:hypothetical protein [Candidatus Lokiarchaeota archaeon]
MNTVIIGRMAMARRAIIYSRVSTDDQKENGFSLQDQENRLRRYCRDNDIEVVKHYQDDCSAKNFNRPSFQRMLKEVKDKEVKADLFICVRWDRFSRNLEKSMEMFRVFKKLKLEIKIVDEGDYNDEVPENKLFRIVNMLIPEIDNDRRGLNTTRGMRQATKEGRWMGSAPVGYKRDTIGDKRRIVPGDKAELIREAFQEFSKGIYKVEELRHKMYKKGLKISESHFHRILRNPVYTGKIRIKEWRDEPEELVRGLHEPLVSEEVFDEVQWILQGRKRKMKKFSKHSIMLPLRGHLVCRICENNLTGSGSRSKTGKKHYYYHCNCGCGERFRADEANALFLDYLRSFQIRDEILILYYKILKDVFQKDDIDRGKEI